MNNKRYKIILAGDIQENTDQSSAILRTFYEVHPAQSAAKLFEILDMSIPDLIIMDIDMPEMNGYAAAGKIKADDRYKDIPIIFVSARDDPNSEVEGFDIGAADYLVKPFSPPLLLKRIEKELLLVKQKNDLLGTHAELQNHLDNLETLVSEKAETVLRLQNAVLSTVIDLVELRDKYTGGHINRTQLYLKSLIGEMIKDKIYSEEISMWNIEYVLSSAKLYDIGKIVVPDMILSKDDKLTEDEFETVKTHISAGVDAIERIIGKTENADFFEHALRITGTHHERWDGRGYPIGLRGRSIPLEGRLMAIADVYDALISKRQYKEALSHHDACEIIVNDSGKQFDPQIVNVFRKIEKEFEQIAVENR